MVKLKAILCEFAVGEASTSSLRYEGRSINKLQKPESFC